MTTQGIAGNPAAEWSVVSAMVFDPEVTAEIVGTQLAAEDFLRPDAKLLYSTAVESFYADRVVEPLSVAEACKVGLAKQWDIPEEDVSDELLRRLMARDYGQGTMEHVGIVKRLSTARKLFSIASRAMTSLAEAEKTPEEVAATLSADALAITGGGATRTELMSWMETGTEYAKFLQRQMMAREQGIELAVYTGYPFIDEYTKGIAPTEFAFIAGPPGVGKSILGWLSAEGFALRQLKRPAEHRVGTLIVSMEMGVIPSSTRLAQSITEIDGMRLREGDINQVEFREFLREWKARDGLPIYFNFASNFRLSQLRALIVEAIRRYNVGFVILDHFRQIDTDQRVRDSIEADEVKARFLKEAIAKDLNVAVMCLGHTIKIGRDGSQRPRMSDVRGNQQLSATADFIGLMFNPSENLTEMERMQANVSLTDAELIWVKARHTAKGTAYYSLQPATMTMSQR